MANYENIYQGAADYFVPKYQTVGYNLSSNSISAATDVRTANQLKEVNVKLNTGAKNFEVQGVFPDVWKAIPDQHLEEINRLAKLTGIKPSLHGPLIEASGVGERGWNEMDRELAENKLADVMQRANKLDPNGNIVVTFHSTQQLPELEPTIKTKEGEKKKTIWVINPETGKFGAIEAEKRYFPEEGKFTGKAREFDVEKELKKINEDAWVEQLSDINRTARYGNQEIDHVLRQITDNEELTSEKKQQVISILKGSDEAIATIKNEHERAAVEALKRDITHGQIYYRGAYRNLRSLFDKAWEKADEDDKKILRQYAEEIAPIVEKGIENDPTKFQEFERIIDDGIKTLSEIKKPNMYIKMQDFVLDKSSETFANVASSAYKKFGEKAPIISIENPPAGQGLSKAEDLRKLVEESRKKFADNLIKEKGMGRGEANAIAEKLIGATWDVGHINMIRGFGYEKEDVIKQTGIIAPFVKHIHLSDNFGFEHSELPMGMGNVPLKEMMKKIGASSPEKNIKSVIEAGDWYQHFVSAGEPHPLKATLQAFDSPLYSMYEGPSWGQLGGYQPYYTGHGPINPPIHHTTYGAGFTTLPTELGGEIQGGTSRFSGTPNA
jgi:sugar phosphate isomerase/epimerase